MAGKKIVWSGPSGDELRKVLNYFILRNGNINYSLKLLNQVEDLLDILSKNEFIGRLTSNQVTRVIPLEQYLIFYEIQEGVIEIVSFWDNRQDPKKKRIGLPFR